MADTVIKGTESPDSMAEVDAQGATDTMNEDMPDAEASGSVASEKGNVTLIDVSSAPINSTDATLTSQLVREKLEMGVFRSQPKQKAKSSVWKLFNCIVDGNGRDTSYVICKYCFHVMYHDSHRTGTSTMRKHKCWLEMNGVPPKKRKGSYIPISGHEYALKTKKSASLNDTNGLLADDEEEMSDDSDDDEGKQWQLPLFQKFLKIEEERLKIEKQRLALERHHTGLLKVVAQKTSQIVDFLSGEKIIIQQPTIAVEGVVGEAHRITVSDATPIPIVEMSDGKPS
ncbi:unnamed protein product [Darwinula stevensoni]|uniref:BED-type domain-containing protein n=1 Tax=Darwinula stevensoni TaxID=69355 RepID=A0A7R8XFT3_9CRUS|nr:unnamed protein product [Darwinula stevensoni]CAG0895668.1 unnamed protein product [Darwinula stevensoni]